MMKIIYWKNYFLRQSQEEKIKVGKGKTKPNFHNLYTGKYVVEVVTNRNNLCYSNHIIFCPLYRDTVYKIPIRT